jgi:HEPN superfamily Toprim-like protein
VHVGTAITLSLNGIDIDYGQDRSWRRHHWLFPPDSITEIDYLYADDVTETKSGFETALEKTRFRLCHLGYSLQETRTRFESAVTRWNRTADLRLSFADFHGRLTSLDFPALTSADLEPYVWDFRRLVLDLFIDWDTNNAGLEDFIFGLDFAITLRVLADPIANRLLPLRWHHQDLIDSGWASVEDLADVDRETYIINHTMFVGRLQDYANAITIRNLDDWLVGRGVPRATPYTRLQPNGAVTHETTTLPIAVRNKIHHPENPHNTLSDQELGASVELLLEVAKGLPTPLPGLL